MRIRSHGLYLWVRRHIASVAFVSGFVWDVLTLKHIDLVYENVVFVSYLIIVFLGILLIHSVETKLWAPPWLQKGKAWLPAIVQFPLGGLFSGFVIFYSKSASIFFSWPFLVLLLTLLLGNEFLRRRYERLTFQISFFFFSLLSYLVLVTPVVLGRIDTNTFILSTVLALFIVSVLLQVVMWLFPDVYKRSMRAIWFAIIGIFVGFHVLYFTNTIPPVPLALSEIGVYHSVTRVADGYRLRYEEPLWYMPWRTTGHIYHKTTNEAAYCFASVYAPTVIQTRIYHSWQRKSANGAWVRETRIPYTIEGGRERGYRGYTIKTYLPEGSWRCVVETEKGLVIGHVRFEVVAVNEPVPQVEATR
jgi:hypothetical protein